MATGSQAEPTRAPGGSVSLLTVENLKVAFDKGGGRLLPVIDAVNLELGANQAMGVVGESGSGKTMLCRSIVGTLARRPATTSRRSPASRQRSDAGRLAAGSGRAVRSATTAAARARSRR